MTDPETGLPDLAAEHRQDLLDRVRWDTASPLTLSIETAVGACRIRHGRFVGGVSDGVEVVEVDTGAARVVVLPSRGMGIWKIEAGGIRFGWLAPASGPVHPSHVPLFDPSGLGWLEGFDELLVRCGLESNGAPEFDDAGRVRYPLHGRIGNLPAERLRIEYDGSTGSVDLVGEIAETRLFFKRLRLRCRLRFHAGTSEVEIRDEVVNEASTPASIQMLYHINLGRPLLGEGAVVDVPLRELAPKDERSAAEIDRWNEIGPPETGYAERVYFAEPTAGASGWTTAMLRTAESAAGLAVAFRTQTLPRFILWKNSGSEADGYVTGIEPATNFPNNRSFEASQGRVVELPPGGSATFELILRPLVDADAVATASGEIEQLRHTAETEIHRQPRAGWSPG